MEDSNETKDILDRLKLGVGAKSKTDLARILGIAQQSIFNAQAKGKIPDGWVRKVAETHNISTDWLYFGEGTMYRTNAISPAPSPHVGINKQVLVDVIEIMEECLTTAQKQLPSKTKAELLYQLYKLVMEGGETSRQPIRMFRLIHGALADHE